jgi:hypothetical protein
MLYARVNGNLFSSAQVSVIYVWGG